MLKIYGVPISVHTRKVVVNALHKELAYEVISVVPVIPGNPPPDWRTLSPTGLIPVLQDGDFTLGDSAAICAYLERRHPGRPLMPRDDRAHARALWFEQYAGGTVFASVVHPLFRETFVQPQVHKIRADQGKIDTVLTEVVPEVFGYLDSVAGDAFLAGAEPSLADVAVTSNLVTMQYIGFALDAARFPRLAGLFERTIAFPAMRQALRNEQPVVQSMGLQSDFLRAVLV